MPSKPEQWQLDERPIRAVVGDDEPLARRLIGSLLKELGGFDIVAEAGDGAAAVAAITLHRPDVAFLDINMPQLDGIRAAERIAALMPIVVFVTAYDEHALQAFEVGGLDYVLKPIDKTRFAAAVEKVRCGVRRRRIESAFEAAIAKSKSRRYLDHLRLKRGSEVVFLPAAEILWIQSANQYANVHEKSGASWLVSRSLRSFELELDPRIFFRVHRSAIVNRTCVDEVRTNGKGAICLVLAGRYRVPVARQFKEVLSEIMIR